eukprot:TRINITY_DN3657_c0_g1_i1.p1 TRINITY_DN3657_c0_g1~~TRINITY_DN3657_c0_g1_i1.p1  ORF type:complete len:514 (+),score=165.25 TRINITY_DN3657_c0_g1_i1:78-1619(+)
MARRAAVAALLLLGAAADHEVNIRYKGCGAAGGRPVPNKEQAPAQCNVKKLTRGALGTWPAMDMLDLDTMEMSGLANDIYEYVCAETEALAGVKCYSVRMAGASLFPGSGYPGEALTGGVVDFTTGYYSALVRTSFLTSEPISQRMGNHFVVKAGSAMAAPGYAFPNQGDGLVIVLACHRPDAAAVRATYSGAEFGCNETLEAQLAAVERGSGVDAAWVTAHEAQGVDLEKFVVLGPEHSPALLASETDRAGFLFAKDNVCAWEAMNAALHELITTPRHQAFLNAVCNMYPLTCVGQVEPPIIIDPPSPTRPPIEPPSPTRPPIEPPVTGTPTPKVAVTPTPATPTPATIREAKLGAGRAFKVQWAAVPEDEESRKICFSAEVDETEWVALGFSKDGKEMKDSDIIMGYMQDGVGQSKNLRGLGNVKPAEGFLVNTVEHVGYENGRLEVCLVRKIEAVGQVVPLTASTHLIWAVGKRDADGEPEYHGWDAHDDSGDGQINRSDEIEPVDFITV